MTDRATPTERLVQLDAERLSDCLALSDVLYTETGVEIAPDAIRDALRTLHTDRRRWSTSGPA